MTALAALQPDVFHYRALRGKLVAALVGTSPNQLAGWSRRGLLESSSAGGRRGRPRRYSWVDYQKARALCALLERGVPNRQLAESIAALDATVEDWWKLALSEFQDSVIVPCDDGRSYAIVEKRRAADRCICEADPIGRRIADSGAALALDVICALRRQGPLGRLCEFGEHVNMDPHIQEGDPVIRGRRIETEMLGILNEWGTTTAEMADLFDLTHEQIEAGVAFEQALAG